MIFISLGIIKGWKKVQRLDAFAILGCFSAGTASNNGKDTDTIRHSGSEFETGGSNE